MNPIQRRGRVAHRRLTPPNAGEPRPISHGADEKSEWGLATLFRAYGSWLKQVLRRQYGQGAEDLVQETFLRATRYGSGKVVVRHPRALLLRIAKNAATDQARRNAEVVARDSVVVELAEYMREVAESADQIEALLLKELILQMPATYRDVFVLSRFRGMSYQMIAQELRIPLKTVEWRMSKALAYCTEMLADPGSD